MKVYRARAGLEWLPFDVLFKLAEAVGWTRRRLAAEIGRQLGLTPRRDDVEKQELIEVLVSKVML